MRCAACDKLLTDFEGTIRLTSTDDFLDLCGKCRLTIVDTIQTTERYNLFDPDLDLIDNMDNPENFYVDSKEGDNEDV